MSKTNDFLKLTESQSVGGKGEEPVEGAKVKSTSVDSNLSWSVFIKWLEQDDEEGDSETSDKANPDMVKLMIHIHCDLMMQYLQTRQHHWHVQGMIFRDVHLMFDEATEELLEMIDSLAERTVATGAIVPTDPESITEISDIPRLDQTSRDPKAMLQQSIDAIKDILEDIAELNDIASEEKETGIVNLIGGIAEDLEVLLYKYQQYLSVFS